MAETKDQAADVATTDDFRDVAPTSPEDEKTTKLTSPAGTKVTAPASMRDALKAQGYK